MTLDAILVRKREEVRLAKAARPLADLLPLLQPSDRSFVGALRDRSPAFIMEVKPRSPSEGPIRAEADLEPVLAAYRLRADAVSVLTDTTFFGGSPALLARVRATVRQPILAKDFIVDPYQVAALRLAGADAVLLILAALDDPTYRAAAALATSLGMGVLTEVHDEAEMARAVTLGAAMIGINARNLKTMAVSLAAIPAIAARAPAGTLLIAESGIRDRGDIVRIGPSVDGFLIGTTLMRASDPDSVARRLVFGPTKICGLTRPEDAAVAAHAGATHGGLVFAPSRRQVNLAMAARIRASAPLAWVGVFADDHPDRIGEAAEHLGLRAVQLHGAETREVAEQVRQRLPDDVELWRAVPVSDTIGPLTPPADRWLLDNGTGRAFGGTGRTFDWSLLPTVERPEACIVSGGLTEANVGRVPRVGVDFFDVSSGVESEPGRKDPDRIRRFLIARRLRAARGGAA